MKKENEELSNVKLQRREAILSIISGENVETQSELTEKLTERGFRVTQATVSRDIRELHLVKAPGSDGTSRYQPQKSQEIYKTSGQFFNIFKSSVVRVDSALNQVVIHSYTGMAQAVCATMDGLEWPGVLGTIAGDDTILVITQDEKCAAELAAKLRSMH